MQTGTYDKEVAPAKNDKDDKNGGKVTNSRRTSGVYESINMKAVEESNSEYPVAASHKQPTIEVDEMQEPQKRAQVLYDPESKQKELIMSDANLQKVTVPEEAARPQPQAVVADQAPVAKPTPRSPTLTTVVPVKKTVDDVKEPTEFELLLAHSIMLNEEEPKQCLQFDHVAAEKLAPSEPLHLEEDDDMPSSQHVTCDLRSLLQAADTR